MISHVHKAIFIHIQKTGGSAVSAALGYVGQSPDKHFLAQEIKGLHAEIWDKYFKFSFVRNPWDRLVSWWSMIDAVRPAYEASSSNVNNFMRFVLGKAKTFEEFLENCDQEIVDSDGRKWIYRNQIDYLTDAQGAYLVDFIGRFESLQKDFTKLSERLTGKAQALVHFNTSKHGPYTTYYTPALANKVGDRYARDLARFGYQFGKVDSMVRP
jgi:hypothetical protein